MNEVFPGRTSGGMSYCFCLWGFHNWFSDKNIGSEGEVKPELQLSWLAKVLSAVERVVCAMFFRLCIKRGNADRMLLLQLPRPLLRHVNSNAVKWVYHAGWLTEIESFGLRLCICAGCDYEVFAIQICVSPTSSTIPSAIPFSWQVCGNKMLYWFAKFCH